MNRLTAWTDTAVPVLVLLVCVSALVYEGVGGTTGQVAAVLGIAAGWMVVVLRIGTINTYALISGLCFGVLGIASLWLTRADIWQSLFLSQAAALKYILLYGSVIWLRVQAQNSRALAQLADWLMQATGWRKRLGLPFLGHFMGAGFNLAGLGLVTPVIDAAGDAKRQRQNFVSIIHGFSLATAWSPVFASIIVVLAAFPDLTWFDIAPGAMMVSAALFAAYQGVARVLEPGGGIGAPSINPTTQTSAPGVRFPYQPLFIVISLLWVLVMVVWLTQWPVTVALGIVAPAFALIWLKTTDSESRAVKLYMNNILAGLGRLHSEIFVFAMANLLVVGVASLLDTGLVASIDTSWVALNWTIFALLYLAVTMIGVHPLVFVLVGVQLIPASTLGVSNITFAVLILALWTSSTIGSPMSANNLMFSKVLDKPVWTLAWVWNGPAVLINWSFAYVLGLVLVWT